MKRSKISDLDFSTSRRHARRAPAKRARLHLAAGITVTVFGVLALSMPDREAEALKSEDTTATPTTEVSLALPGQASKLDSDRIRIDAGPVQAATSEPQTEEATPSPDVAQPASITAEGNETIVTQAVPQGFPWQTEAVKSGDSMAAIFKRAGLTPRELYEIMNSGDAASALKRIFPGDEIHFQKDDEGKLFALRYPVDESITLEVNRQQDVFESVLVANPLERRVNHASATIDSSLFLAGQSAELSDSLIMELAGIFGWDIDFALDMRAGDQFTVIYEELYRDGEKVRDGDIIAAQFVNNGRVFQALRYTDTEGNTDYYSPDGRSMRKAFLRTPMDIGRISSGFSLKRWHPVLKTWRAHRGVDYAAPPGTPIKTTGSGKITYAGWKNGYGRVVIVQHGGRYTTLYAHMSRFARGISAGGRVKQGQTIGYVGSSGLASGPHLHYEFRVNGVHRNPLTVKLPDAEPIAKHLREDFEQAVQPLVSQLAALAPTSTVASADDAALAETAQ